MKKRSSYGGGWAPVTPLAPIDQDLIRSEIKRHKTEIERLRSLLLTSVGDEIQITSEIAFHKRELLELVQELWKMGASK